MVTQGKSFDAIAKALDSQGIDLGSVEKGDLPEGLAEAVFKLPAGGTSQPVKTALGWHVVKIGQIQAARIRTLDEVREQLEQDLLREKSLDGLGELANKVEDALGGGATLEEAAKRFDLKLTKFPAVDAGGRGPNGKQIGDLPKSDQFLDVAFQTEPNTESPLTELRSGGYFLLRVDGVTAPAPKPLPDIKAEVVATWQAERRHDLARQKAEALAEKLKSGSSIATLAQSVGAKVETTQPFGREPAEGSTLPPAIIAELFRVQPGGVAIGSQQSATLVARLARIEPFDSKANPPATEAAGRRVAQSLGADIADQYVSALNTTFGVKVDRSQLSREE